MQRYRSGDEFPTRESYDISRAHISQDEDDGTGRSYAEGGECPVPYTQKCSRISRNRYTLTKGDRSVDVDALSCRQEHSIVSMGNLLSLLDAPPSEVVFTLVLCRDELDVLLDTAAQDGPSLTVLLRVLGRACTCEHDHHVRHLLATVTSSDTFLQHVQQQILCRMRTHLFWNHCVAPLAAMLEKTAKLLTDEEKTRVFAITSTLLDIVNIGLQEGRTIDLNVVHSVERTGIQLAGATQNDLRGYERLLDAYTGNGDSDNKSSAILEELITSRDISEFNCDGDALASEVTSSADYVKFQIMSLRCQFMLPLVRTLRQMQTFTSSGEAAAVPLYSGVRIGQVVCTSHGVGHKVLYVPGDQASGTQLRPGCMVCISNDNFHNILLGTVLWKSSDDSERGHIVVSFLEVKPVEAVASSRGLVMFETPLFYKDHKAVFDLIRQFDVSDKRIPFSRYLIDKQPCPSPPNYVDHNTVFDMTSLFNKRTFVHPLKDRSWPPFNESTLDSHQYDAFHSVMSQDLALIEGMPGSGKAYLIQCVLRIIRENREVCPSQGRMLLVALRSEVLEALLTLVLEDCKDVVCVDDSEDDMIKPFVLKQKNRQDSASVLHALHQEHKKEAGELKTRIALEQDRIRMVPTALLSENEIKCAMTDQHYRSLFFSTSNARGNIISFWLQTDNIEVSSRYGSPCLKDLTDDDVRHINDVWALDMESRYRLYSYWQSRYIEKLTAKLGMLMERFKFLVELQNEVQEALVHEALKGASVVGCTVSALPKVWKALRGSTPHIAILAEARSIPEVFLLPLVMLNPRHLVLVSDREIIRQKGKDFVSLFERLVEQGTQCNILLGQHRYGPSTSAVLESFKKKKLTSRLEYHSAPPPVLGVSQNLHFATHNLSYEKNILIASTFEAEFLVSLSKHLLFQGYQPNDIQVFASSIEQARLIESLMESPAPIAVSAMPTAPMKVTTIVLLSFAASYPVTNLREQNDAILSHYYAMSSAGVGLYAIGNVDYLASQFPIWKDVRKVLEEENSIGGSLQLRCQIHPNKVTNMSCARDFDDVSGGGCDIPCEARLPCGHTCQKRCHVIDRYHTYTTCGQPCKELLPCDHQCTGLCGEPCQKECLVMVNALSPCDHVVRVQCSRVGDVDLVRRSCSEICRKKIRKGVRCSGICSECYANGVHSGDNTRSGGNETDGTCTVCAVM
ncbi:NFX1-type zinc finger-containing protein 1-like [Ornithodoros turicata]|uniref:NFX1-type zinc finger-containing protein 1-like n=1 Tax=Ornithodoros turicata TaxID=34597 RepID=UPI003138FA51